MARHPQARRQRASGLERQRTPGLGPHGLLAIPTVVGYYGYMPTATSNFESKRAARALRGSTKYVGGAGHYCKRGTNTKGKGRK